MYIGIYNLSKLLFGNYIYLRHAKRHLDTRGFFGGVLHVFYAPELETIHEVREKLNQRRREVTQRIAKNQGDLYLMNLAYNKFYF